MRVVTTKRAPAVVLGASSMRQADFLADGQSPSGAVVVMGLATPESLKGMGAIAGRLPGPCRWAAALRCGRLPVVQDRMIIGRVDSEREEDHELVCSTVSSL
jgi:hypothetical protein